MAAIEPNSELARIVGKQELPVNSSHHQSAGKIGDGLRVVAQCPADGIIEAIEGTNPDHFVLAVQWHPERSFDGDSRFEKFSQRSLKPLEVDLLVWRRVGFSRSDIRGTR